MQNADPSHEQMFGRLFRGMRLKHPCTLSVITLCLGRRVGSCTMCKPRSIKNAAFL